MLAVPHGELVMIRKNARWGIILLSAMALGLPGVSSANSGSTACPEPLSKQVAKRSSKASGGSKFIRRIEGKSESEREAAIRDELLAGNLPEFLNQFTPVTLRGKSAAGEVVEITVCVSPDYLAVGSDEDFLRVPMGLDTAVQVASAYGAILPTRKIVDAIYAQSETHLTPRPMKPGAAMTSTDYYVRHNRGIDAQIKTAGKKVGTLTAGHKKDLVITNRLRAKPGRVAIYGWHRSNGKPIQPVSTVHGARYADYSHGVRLISNVAYVDGKETQITAILEDPQLARILNDEGPIPQVEKLVTKLGGGSVAMRTATARSGRDS